MTAWLKLVPTWGWALLVGLLLAGAQQIRISGLQGDLVAERGARIEDAGKLGACRTTRTNLLELTIEQNSALAGLRSAEHDRADKARQAQKEAEGGARQADQQAQQVLQERLSPGADACAAASAAFDDELRRERGL